MNLLPRRRATIAVGAAVILLGSTGLAYAGLGAPTGGLDDKGGARRLSGDQTTPLSKQIQGGRAHNVILLIGDGMGDSEITLARNYAKGAAGRFAGIDALPLTGSYTTYSLDKTTELPDYVPDSAATGSGWSTGTKTYDGAISVDVHGKDQPTLLELAKLNGLKTGDVSTAELQDATPAVEVAHVSQRKCYGPSSTLAMCPEDALENGGPGSITEQLLDTRPDVTLGGGAATFEEKATAGEYQGKTLREQAVERGYRLVDDADGLAAVDAADQDTPLLGLFADGNMPVRYVGPAATAGGSKLPAQKCTANPDRPATQPRLAAMTKKAIDLLDGPRGFFLQVEGASIDKQDHAADACGQIGETVDLDEAVQVALAYAKKQGNTSVFVTADHAHTSQIIEVGSDSPGATVTLETVDGAPMTVNYGTAPLGSSQQHTGTQVRIAGYGPQAANVVGLTDQTDLFFTISRALGLTEDPKAASKDAVVTVDPASAQVGKPASIRARKFHGDRSITFFLRGPGGQRVTKHQSASYGAATSAFVPRKAGQYTVFAKGDQTGVSRKATFTAKGGSGRR